MAPMIVIQKFLVALVIGIPIAVSCESTPIRLQVFVTRDVGRAGEILAKVDAAGFGPGVIEAKERGYCVLTGEFPSLAEANFAKPSIRDAGFSDVFAIRSTSSGGLTPSSIDANVPILREAAAFGHFKVEFSVPPTSERRKKVASSFASSNSSEASIDVARAGAVELLSAAYRSLRAEDRERARRLFQQVLERHPEAIEAGEARLRLAYMLIAERAPLGECLKAFREVASGKVPASPDVRAEAILRMAALYARGKDFEMADAAYAALDVASANPEVKAFAKVQRAGIRLEQAWNGKSTFDSARSMCDDVLIQYPYVDRQTRATAALMAMETLAYEKKYTEVLARSEYFIDNFSGLPETPLGYYLVAKSLFETGDALGAVQILESIAEAKFPTSDRFRIVDVTPAARSLAAEAYDRLGNQAKAAEFRRRVDSE